MTSTTAWKSKHYDWQSDQEQLHISKYSTVQQSEQDLRMVMNGADEV